MKQIMATYSEGNFEIIIFSIQEESSKVYQVVIQYRNTSIRFYTNYNTLEEAKNYMFQEIQRTNI